MESKIPNDAEPTQDYVLLTVLSVFFGLLGITLLYVVLKVWPSGISGMPEEVCLFGRSYTFTPEHRYLLLMTLGGALGASVHLLISFTAFVGNRSFVTSWVPWYMLRPIIGAAMALFFYMLLRGGILTYGTVPPANSNDSTAQAPPADTAPAPGDSDSVKIQSPPPSADSTDTTKTVGAAPVKAAKPPEKPKNPPKPQPAPVPPLNPFGMMAIACMVGLFSKEASKKLEELFKTLFNVRADQQVPFKDKLPTDKRGTIPANTIAVTPSPDANTAKADDINDVLPDADEDDDATDPDHKDAEPQG
ncbi:hypothetical protein [Chitinophaga sp. GbtcB8]|uniref:hypothetical protein n=1 Tax=Chitinophaga sp. GbtcB8 TaxID=2824753 RepID=UPI001C303840|nr:hypothetical protein [Chitinophaga sp. GbtcB8]